MSTTAKLRANRTAPDDYRTWSAAGSVHAQGVGGAAVRVAILALPQASMANMTSVFEDLQAVNVLGRQPGQSRRFSPKIVSCDGAPKKSVSGLMLTPDAALDDQQFDAIVVPTLYDDGCLTDPDYGTILNAAETDWLLAQHRNGAFLVTMCSGAYGLAEAGVLDGYDSAMHPLYAEPFQRRFPQVRVLRNRTLVVSGARREIVTGGQSVYSADVSLYMIAHFHGAPLALEFAMLYGRTWTEAMHEETLINAVSDNATDEIVNLAKQFFQMHLADAGLVSAAADLSNLSVRTFSRRFARSTGMAPGQYVIELRLQRAMRLLAGSRINIEDIAARVGYSDRSAFAKAFREKTGIPPAEYRIRFKPSVDLRNRTRSAAAKND